MSLGVTDLDTDAILDSPQVLRATKQLAGDLAAETNRTSAEVGITYRVQEDRRTVRVGPRGAAALPLEVGTRRIPARRTFKRALDRRRIE